MGALGVCRARWAPRRRGFGDAQVEVGTAVTADAEDDTRDLLLEGGELRRVGAADGEEAVPCVGHGEDDVAGAQPRRRRRRVGLDVGNGDGLRASGEPASAVESLSIRNQG